jgi:hypothetical protein
VAILPASEAAAQVTTACPDDTYWDGTACTHPRATCGAWDGLSCAPARTKISDDTRQAFAEYASLSQRALEICQDNETTKRRYIASLPALESTAKQATDNARHVDDDFAQLRGKLTNYPPWLVATFVSAGEMYDCVWTHMREATIEVIKGPSPVIPPHLSPEARALMERFRALRAPPPSAPPGLSMQAPSLDTILASLWKRDCDYFFVEVEDRLVHNYINAALLARRYALNGYDLTRAHDRLPVVADILGVPRMTWLVHTLSDPTDLETDEAHRRPLQYSPGLLPP